MAEMQEYWSNVIVCEGCDGKLYSGLSVEYVDSEFADSAMFGNMNSNRFRIHVRLKPEGAPARYRDAEHRWHWETYPAAMRDYAR